ncbi:MAG: hypothetical protein ABJJ25_15245 [Eudoraea sp.]|uniref:hypothetical protein n=1 Tax=Eudoraea sp. TaxID=1979955 RepID=UPI0032662705
MKATWVHPALSGMDQRSTAFANLPDGIIYVTFKQIVSIEGMNSNHLGSIPTELDQRMPTPANSKQRFASQIAFFHS